MKTIYVVMGSTGEYSDRSEWMVRAFVSEAAATALAEAASVRAREIFAAREGYRYDTRANEHDPNMDMDYTGTTYWIAEVELDESEPAVQA